MLEDLSEQNFKKFCAQLQDRREEPRVRRNRGGRGTRQRSNWRTVDISHCRSLNRTHHGGRRETHVLPSSH
ncbi:apoptosis-associated speck-like protein containing a CARD [Lates japonicus]|uniref:Apoptosis-associated speck-like protein containing a CARD n=1 Tax=Lates japonicus TaxID=270547 RepID=A0AAD3MGE5_LATJO|nr:apoptosis-associated speck-like protein containing a CARD [Lates japonicus]